MKERPILFKAEMVRAILSGAKTQTRRVVKHIPMLGYPEEWCGLATSSGGIQHIIGDYRTFCKHGKIGDRIWVRETFVIENTYEYHGDHTNPTDERPMQIKDGYWLIPHYRATEPEPNMVTYEQDEDDDTTRWRPSIFMPRWASRIMLEITDVRIERLNDISEADARAEGIVDAGDDNGWQLSDTTHYSNTAVNSYASLWESINGDGSWEANPWVWAITFRRLN